MKIKSLLRTLVAFVLLHSVATQVIHGQTWPDDAMQLQKRADEYLHIISAGAPGFDRIVTKKPFSAIAVTDTIRILEDGHRIVRQNVMKEYRDRQGRTRREQTLEALSPSTPVAPKEMIFIFDPVLHINYVLDPEAKVARKFTPPGGALSAELALLSTESHENQGLLAPQTHVEDLGKRLIAGLQCSGARTTTILPKGIIGNDAPIVIVRETWFSQDIEAVVLSKTVDPRFGTTDYHLMDIWRSDVTPDLFRVPSSFRMDPVSD